LDKYAVIGERLGHSLSPEIHNTAFRHYGISADYSKLEIPAHSFDELINRLKQQNYSGFNVTIPYKTAIIPHLYDLSDEARSIGAVNTIKCEKGQWHGYNTDAAGFLQPLLRVKLNVTKVLLLGAGGAARAVAYAVLNQFPEAIITIAARKIAAVDSFYHAFGNERIAAVGWENRATQAGESNLIINTTPMGMSPHDDQSPLPEETIIQDQAVVYDLIYNPENTMLLRNAVQKNPQVTAISGLEMLIGQADEAFRIWTGKSLPRDSITSRLTSAHKN
jgi:shikimate dehydrogenase